MTNSKSTKRALLTSVFAVVICVAMLIGTTFAWFTDTASTAVNKIQAGTLDVALEMKDNNDEWVTAEGKTLQFKVNGQIPPQKDDGTYQTILWEPGCTYELPELRVINNGNLALKYKIQITGILGNAKLNEVIDWTINDKNINLTEEHLTAGAEGAPFTIKGHMQESAGNDYQGLEITGIAITVVATQDTVESDSFNNIYDALAEYPLYAAAPVETDKNNRLVNEVKLVTSLLHADTGTPVATATVPTGAMLNKSTSKLELIIQKAKNPSNFAAVDITQNEPKTLDISIKGLADDNDKLIKVEFYIEKGLSVVEFYHNGKKMDRRTGLNWLNKDGDDQDFYYDSDTGLVTMLNKTFSPFTYTSDKFYWDDRKADSYKTPIDTSNKTITIASAEELALFKYEITDNKTNYAGYTLNITGDIDLGAGFWRPIDTISNFTINGNNHTIRNMLVRSCTNGGYGCGFIGNATGKVTISNLTFDNADVAFGKGMTYYGNVGSVVLAYAYGTTEFNNVKVINSSLNGYGKIGMLLGMGADPGVKVTFNNCVSKNNTIRAVYNIGGLAGNIQRGSGVDNATVNNCTVDNINVIYDSNEKYIDLNNAKATLKSDDKNSGTDTTKVVSGKWWQYGGFYWGGYADYYVSYGNSSYDAPVEGYNQCLANSEYCVNK